ncbi:hypothetical protein N7533_006615 [Penicillium manginii]|jgi:hypothetical protein|uniref:uncharacterized protein n=1 Tax=Penicillium manginii TaxID=203109 RepID=UPI0025482AAF|nr:uncharacterized protein N7533_006615 [Penicillium manginii]KAJ5749587.1 hypothetical protein N7533_006615 [Penicillium manginii]
MRSFAVGYSVGYFNDGARISHISTGLHGSVNHTDFISPARSPISTWEYDVIITTLLSPYGFPFLSASTPFKVDHDRTRLLQAAPVDDL